MKDSKLFKISIIGAIYVCLCVILAPISFGPIQFRLSELLCLLACEFPYVIVGTTIGCFISNMFFGGLGPIDVIVGSLATLIATYSAYKLRHLKYKDYPFISFLMIIIVNAIMIGFEFGFIYDNLYIIPLSVLEIGLSELAVVLIGLPIYKKLINILGKI